MNRTKPLLICALFACLMAVSAQISIALPLMVPLTLQSAIVCLSALMLEKKQAFMSCLIYVLMGAIGLNVFSGFKGGLSVLLGPTGGFIFAFPLAAYIMAYLIEKNIYKIPALLIGNGIIYMMGTAYFMFMTNNSLGLSLSACVVPFIPGDLLKMMVSLILSRKLKRFSVHSLKVESNF